MYGMGVGDSGAAQWNVKQYSKDMTTFELHEDYRTAAHEALQLLGLDKDDIDMATHYHELFANLGSAEKRLAFAAIEVYKMYTFRERKEQLFNSRDIFEEMIAGYEKELRDGRLVSLKPEEVEEVMMPMDLSVPSSTGSESSASSTALSVLSAAPGLCS